MRLSHQSECSTRSASVVVSYYLWFVKMFRKKKSLEDTHRRMKITIQTKRKIIEKSERGVSVAELARLYNRSTSTICTILKNKDKFKEIDASKGVTRISTQRLRILDDVERLLLIWIQEKQSQGDIVNENIICEKARVIFGDLVKKTPSSTPEEEVFKGSRGWFEKFKRRIGMYSVTRHGIFIIIIILYRTHYRVNLLVSLSEYFNSGTSSSGVSVFTILCILLASTVDFGARVAWPVTHKQ